jgi:WD40 repeat protein
VLAGYESGHVAQWQQTGSPPQWTNTYMTVPHAQPVLSLDHAPKLGYFFTSSADAVLARHALASTSSEAKIVQTKHAGQQSLAVRSDEKIFATAGWDGRIRVYAAKSMKELAVLKWHKEGCYAVAFAGVLDGNDAETETTSPEADEDGTMTRSNLTVSQQRVERSKRTHWLAAGSKDGKVSLWEIY